MKIKKIITLALATTMIMTMGGCGNKSTGTDTPPLKEGGDLKGTVVITGSTSVEKILNDMIDEFQALNADVKINYTGTGSSAGIQDTIDGKNTLGTSSRELTSEEETKNVKKEVFAYDGIAVAINPKNEIKDIKLEDLSKIYSGEIKNWNQLGGNDAPIVVVSREGASGTRTAFEELTGLKDTKGLTTDATVVEGNGNVQQTVAGNENAIGYISFSYIDETVKAVTVDGKEPTAENAKSGDYKLSRPFIFTYLEENLTNEAKQFIEYAKSADGQGFVETHGGIKID